jgi:hypothetical protein
MTGVVDVTVMHALGRGAPKLSSSLETESSSLGYSSRMACSDDDPLWVMPLNTAPESAPFW